MDLRVKVIRSNNGTEFKNSVMEEFCTLKGIKQVYSIARTPQQNGVVERRNKTLIEAARTMLADSKLPIIFFGIVITFHYFNKQIVYRYTDIVDIKVVLKCIFVDLSN